MSNTKAIHVVSGHRPLRTDDLKPGTKVVVKGNPVSDDPEIHDDQYFMVVGIGKWPLINLLNGETIHWERAREMKFELVPAGSSLVIEIAAEKIKLKLRNKYVKGPKRGTSTGV
jgi:hypothetical protein